MVEFSKLDSVQLSDYRPVQPKDVFGTLGLININVDTYLCVITAASLVATVRPGEEAQRIDAVEFCEHCMTLGPVDVLMQSRLPEQARLRSSTR